MNRSRFLLLIRATVDMRLSAGADLSITSSSLASELYLSNSKRSSNSISEEKFRRSS